MMKLHERWSQLAIYFVASQVMFSGGMKINEWPFWTIGLLFVIHAIVIRSQERSDHYDTHLGNCEQCSKSQTTSQSSIDQTKS